MVLAHSSLVQEHIHEWLTEKGYLVMRYTMGACNNHHVTFMVSGCDEIFNVVTLPGDDDDHIEVTMFVSADYDNAVCEKELWCDMTHEGDDITDILEAVIRVDYFGEGATEYDLYNKSL